MRKAIRYLIVGIILAGLILGYYWILANRDHTSDNESGKNATQIEEYDRIVNKNFEEAYPETPRGVVTWYNRISTEYYSVEHSDKEIEALGRKMRELLDEELLEANPENVYLTALKLDVSEWQERNAKIVTSTVASSNDVKYATVDGDEVAYVTSYYCTKEGSDLVKSYQEFCLRKDSDGKWKILTWRLVAGDESDYK